MARIQRYLQLASEEAHLSDMAFRHGAVVVSSGRIMTCGHNQTRPRLNRRNYCSWMHCTALNRVWPRVCRGTKNENNKKRRNKKKSAHNRDSTRSGLRSADLFVVRITAAGEFCNSRPCHLCVQWMAHYGVRRVFYSSGPALDCHSIPWEVELVADLAHEEGGYTTRSERFVATQFGQMIAGSEIGLSKAVYLL